MVFFDGTRILFISETWTSRCHSLSPQQNLVVRGSPPRLVPEVHGRQGVQARLHQRRLRLQHLAQNALGHAQDDVFQLASRKLGALDPGVWKTRLEQ